MSTIQGCHRSLVGYPSLVAKALTGVKLVPLYEHLGGSSKFDFVACSGARVADLYQDGAGKQQNDKPVDAAQVSGAGATTSYVTLTIGGNDAGFTDLLHACLVAAHKEGRPPAAKVYNLESFIKSVISGDAPELQSPADCENAISEFTTSRLQGLRTKLSALYKTILDDAPNARLIVTNYPRLFRPSFTGVQVANVRLCAAMGSLFKYQPGFYAQNVPGLDAYQRALNSEIQAAYDSVQGAYGERIILLDLYGATTNNGLTCGDKRVTYYVSGLLLAFSTRVVSTASFHPTKAGQSFIAQRVLGAFGK